MKEKKNKRKNKEKRSDNEIKRKKQHDSTSSSESDEWVEKEPTSKTESKDRDDWMSMTGMLKTYTKDDVKPKSEDKEKRSIDSYDPGTCSRELNPYWKNGGTGLPQTSDSIRKSKPFMKPSHDEDYYSRPANSGKYQKSRDDDDYLSARHKSDTKSRDDSRQFKKPTDSNKDYTSSSTENNYRKPRYDDDNYYSSSSYKSERKFRRPLDDDNDSYYSPSSSKSNDQSQRHHSSSKSSSWRKTSKREEKCSEIKNESSTCYTSQERLEQQKSKNEVIMEPEKKTTQSSGKYLSDEKMNKLAAKIVKAEIMGDMKSVNELKAKLEDAREYRKQNPNAGHEEDEGVVLLSTNSMGNSRPLTKSAHSDPRSKGGKRKTETHLSGERQKYFGDDDKYKLSEMFEQEKYGSNYDNDAQLANITSKHKNPNDDLEDIFTDEISKNTNAAKEEQRDKDRAIKQHVKMEKSLEGCEHCIDSKNMIKHLMVSCGSRVYLALPARKSLVKGHCIITTIQHATCVTAVDEDVWEEIMDYRKALTLFFNSQNMDVLFFETATRLHKFPHLVINCVPLPRDVGDMAAIYFKKALLECEAEWSMNKKVIDLKGKNVRKGVPKGLPYFWIDFAMDPGFAHIIEDQQLFPKAFAEEIVGGILDLDHNLWKNPQKEQRDQQRKKVIEFVGEWKSFDTVAKR